jgi:spoIIIJ-associated protein
MLEQGRRGLFGIGAKAVRIRVMPPVEGMPDNDELMPAAHGRAGDQQAPAREGRPGRRGGRNRGGGNERKKREGKRRKGRDGEKQQREAERQGRGGENKRRGRRRRGNERKRRAAERPKLDMEVVEAQAPEVAATVQKMVELMGLELKAEARAVQTGVTLDLDGEDRELLTRKDGELVTALQFLLNRMARRAWPGAGRIHISCNGNRQQRDEDLVELTREVIQQVENTGKAKRLHPMNAYERRLVHIEVREHGGLGSRSEGNGYLKRVRIFKPKPAE